MRAQWTPGRALAHLQREAPRPEVDEVARELAQLSEQVASAELEIALLRRASLAAKVFVDWLASGEAPAEDVQGAAVKLRRVVWGEGGVHGDR